ncbi:TVP38/TMEM64 family protein [Peribacillus sp. SCS-155]|uniref:TVP38/TMEM64 family protein n=1 Tax=Peribacillus sedimenti TaxID=3115297 RepID=UPI0039069C50
MRKLPIVLVYLLVFLFCFMNKDYILNWIQESDKSNLPLIFLLSVFIATIPVIPFTLYSGIVGAKYGLLLGSLINWFGTVTASAIYFFAARHLFSDYVTAYLKRFKRLDYFQQMIRKNAFIAILAARVIPIIPTPVVNIYSGIAGIPFSIYISATAIGKIPTTVFVAYSGSQILSSLNRFLLGAVIYLIFLFVIILVYRMWVRRGAHKAE